MVLTGNGTQFTTPGNDDSAASLIREALDKGEPIWPHAFEYACAGHHIGHRFSKPNHPSSRSATQALPGKAMDQRPSGAHEPNPEGGAAVKRYFYDTHEQLRTHLSAFVEALQLWQTIEVTEGPDAVRVHRKVLDK